MGSIARITGRNIERISGGEVLRSFVPFPLPPQDPPLFLNEQHQALLKAAQNALGRLELAGEMVPSLDWFIYAFVRKEAVVSSQIEGTQATLVDLLEFEADTGEQADDEVRDVCNFLEAVTYARRELSKPTGLPVSMRLLNEAHRRLMKGVRGSTKQPGEVRLSQNWIGGTRPGAAMFVPPPPEELPALLSQFEKYLHEEDGLPLLVRAGLAHVQFETLHPYLDGNGRIGRLLITLLLEHWEILSAPLLYLSLHFKRHREEYYRRLTAVRNEGDWEGWTTFFLEGVASIAEEAVQTARDLYSLVEEDRARVRNAKDASVMAIRLIDHLPDHPILTIARACELLKTTRPTATKAMQLLSKHRVLKETTGRSRDRAFFYSAYLDRLRVGTELDD